MATDKQVRERRQQVWVMLCKGMQQKDIAKALNVSEATITLDIRALQDRSEQSLNDFARKTLPYMYDKCIDGINEIIKECWTIYNANSKDSPEILPLHRISALRLAKDSNNPSCR
jgi:transposase